MMYYREYKVIIGDLEKKLGILGETHIYSASDTKVAKQKIPEFGTVAIEGEDEEEFRKGNLKYVALVFLPALLLYSAMTKRSLDNENALSIAKKLDKNIVRFDDATSEYIGFGRKMVFVAINFCLFP